MLDVKAFKDQKLEKTMFRIQQAERLKSRERSPDVDSLNGR